MELHMLPTAITLLLVLLSTSSIRAQDSTVCEDDKWTYDGNTHTCFRYFNNDKRSWEGSSDYCRQFFGGSDGTKPGHLAKIDDDGTNTLVQELVTEFQWTTWIGLYYTSNGLRWDSFPNEVPKYKTPLEMIPTSTTQSVYIQNYVWRVKSGTDVHPCVCQHYPLPPSTFSCPSSPMRLNTSLDRPMSFQYFRNTWTSLTVRKGTEVIRTCYKGNTQSCTSGQDVSGLRIDRPNVNMPSISVDFVNGVTSHQSGSWEFKLFNSTQTLVTKTCEIEVYEPPTQVKCKQTWTPSSLRVDCVSEKVYPKAVCEWSYKYQDDAKFQRVSDTIVTSPSNEEFNDQGSSFFKSNCSITLRQSDNDPNITTPGKLNLQVKVYPEIQHQQTIETATKTVETSVQIVKPDAPVFRYTNGDNIRTSMILEEDDEMDFTCEIESGIPGVQETIVLCGFNITDTGDRTTKTSSGSSTQIKTTATRDMDRKICVCGGKHITGETSEKTLKIDVRYKATIATFAFANNSISPALNVDDHFSLICRVMGNPSPSVSILRLNGASTRQLINTVVDGIKHTAAFQAKCTDNGQYKCIANNTVKGTIHADEKNVTVFVNCPPTPCNENKEATELTVKTGNKSVLSFCAVAYPAPTTDKFVLEKNNGQTWEKYNLGTNKSVTIEVESNSVDMLERIDVIFHKTTPKDLGQFRLSYNDGAGTNTQSTYFLFNLNELEKTTDVPGAVASSNNIIGPVIGIVIGILVIICGVVLGLVIWKKRGSTSNNDGSFDNLDEKKDGENNLPSPGASRSYQAEANEPEGRTGASGTNEAFVKENETNEKIENEDTYMNIASSMAIGEPHGRKKKKERDELIYVEVVIEPGKKKAVSFKEAIPSKEAVSSTGHMESTQNGYNDFDETVEYSSIDFEATKKFNSQNKPATNEEENVYMNT